MCKPILGQDTFYIQATGITKEETRLYLFDGLGRLVHNQLLQEGSNSVSIKKLGGGMYYLRIENGGDVSVYKVVVD